MKKMSKTNIVIILCILLTACGQASQATPSVVQPTDITTETKTPFPTITPQPSATSTFVPTPKPTYVRPTLIPTIDPALLPDLLMNILSIQSLESANGYNLRQITDWKNGFGTEIRYSYYNFCPGYAWLDKDHILLNPGAGQKIGPGGLGGYINIVPQPIIINLKNETVWLPPVDTSSDFSCSDIYWSRELKVVVITSTKDDEPEISTFSFDGIKLASYTGKLSGISPSRTKIFINNDTIIDLQTNEKTNLSWPLNKYEESIYEGPFWSSDETRLYGCCYFYADLTKGISYRFSEDDFLDSQGNPFEYSGLWLYRGEWVQDSTYFLVHWLAVDDGPVRYLPMFDPATKLFYDLWEEADIPIEWTWSHNKTSNDGNYVWLAGLGESYLVNLTTFESLSYSYPEYPYTHPNIDWSADSEFTWFEIYNWDSKDINVEIFSIPSMKSNPVPVSPLPESEHLWHPTDNIIVYPARNKNALIFLDASTMSFQELPFKDQDSQYKITNLAWNPNGDKLLFITENHILWQVDYPTLENMEQLVASAETIGGAKWSPDGNSISFINGSDIYIVDTIK